MFTPNGLRYSTSVLLVVVATGASSAQPAGRRFEELQPYGQLVQAFRTGGLPDARYEAAHFDGETLSRAVDLLVELRSASRPNARLLHEWDGQRLAAAALLHLELAWDGVDEEDPTLGSLHLDLGGRLAALLAKTSAPELAGFTARWHLASGCRQLNARLFEGARRSFERSARAGSTAELDLARGVIDELPGGATDELCLTASDCPNPNEDRAFVRREQERERQRRSALHFYERALQSQPGWVEAHLRLGYTSIVHGRSAQARQHLEAAAQAAADDYTLYLAHLFLGRLYVREGRLEQAAAAYRRASDAIPGAQSARLALAHVLGEQGQGAAESEILAPWLRPSAGHVGQTDDVDPWWRYASAPRVCEAEAYERWRTRVLQ